MDATYPEQKTEMCSRVALFRLGAVDCPSLDLGQQGAKWQGLSGFAGPLERRRGVTFGSDDPSPASSDRLAFRHEGIEEPVLIVEQAPGVPPTVGGFLLTGSLECKAGDDPVAHLGKLV